MVAVLVRGPDRLGRWRRRVVGLIQAYSTSAAAAAASAATAEGKLPARPLRAAILFVEDLEMSPS